MDSWTSIAVRRSTHKELQDQGKKGESFDDVVRRFLNMPPAEKDDDLTWQMRREVKIIKKVRKQKKSLEKIKELLKEPEDPNTDAAR